MLPTAARGACPFPRYLGNTFMPSENMWTCDGCGREHELRKIDSHRWVKCGDPNQQQQLYQIRMLQLCPSCQLRLRRDFRLKTRILYRDRSAMLERSTFLPATSATIFKVPPRDTT
ncbi:hypothetical protein LCM4573_25040 [Rhizobium sp. LCM 4573]|nr:hypothetical protein LCM4573_25040 [Rhizobium sp. LCM 4573]